MPTSQLKRSRVSGSPSGHGLLPSMPHVQSPPPTPNPANPNLHSSNTEVDGIQLPTTQHSMIEPHDGPQTPKARKQRKVARKIKKESSELSNAPTELNKTASPSPPRARPVKALPRRLSQSPILQTINRRARVKNSPQEQSPLNHAKINKEGASQPRYHLAGPSTSARPTARPSGTSQSQPFPSPSVSGRPLLPFTSDAFSLPAASRLQPKTSYPPRPQNFESLDPQIPSQLVVSHPETTSSQTSTHPQLSSQPTTRRRSKRKANQLDDEEPRPTRSSQRIRKLKEQKEAKAQSELAVQKPLKAKKRKINP
ncbi:hypothetical protein FRC03_001662 [Tulasnella sp. 419]|nr:hypothetical protein FRC03_001662 [Tulasnella sp. 419]